MDQTQSRRYTLLIGINFYLQKPLRGCVRDVYSIKDQLDSKSIPLDSTLLTATAAPGSLPGRLLEEPRQWPTHENVTSHLKSITESSHPGDFVYIHYSGHGTQLTPSSDVEHKRRSTGDLALVLIDGADGTAVRYFRGLELAYHLKNMVLKGLKVSIVLDCCFSGSVPRSELDNARFLPYDARIDEASPPCPAEILDDTYGGSVSRDGSLIPNWMVYPDGYTILTACGPHETAKEIIVSGQQHAGALSHFLLRTLSRLGNVDAKVGDMYQHICSRFADRSWPAHLKQMPMFFGNKNLSFLGVLKSHFNPLSIPVFRSENGLLNMRAGQAHGVIDGDEFDLYRLKAALDSPKDTSSSERVCVSEAGPLVSVLSGLNGALVSEEISIGWNARVVSRPLVRAVPISLASDLPDTLQDAARKRQILLVPETTPDTSWPDSFSVSATTHGEYEIRDDSGALLAKFPLTPDSAGEAALHQVLDVLAHLTRFKQIQGINRPCPSSIQGSFTVRVHARGELQDVETTIQAAHEEELDLEIVNTGQKPLYFHIYDMGPLWQVESMFAGDYAVIPPKNDTEKYTGMETWTLEMSVPDELVGAGKKSCSDTIKIFVTEEPTSFAMLEMEKLSNDSASKSARVDLWQHPIFEQDMTRSAVGDWTVLDIHIRTTI
jgi:hypothetical protein